MSVLFRGFGVSFESIKGFAWYLCFSTLMACALSTLPSLLTPVGSASFGWGLARARCRWHHLVNHPSLAVFVLDVLFIALLLSLNSWLSFFSLSLWSLETYPDFLPWSWTWSVTLAPTSCLPFLCFSNPWSEAVVLLGNCPSSQYEDTKWWLCSCSISKAFENWVYNLILQLVVWSYCFLSCIPLLMLYNRLRGGGQGVVMLFWSFWSLRQLLSKSLSKCCSVYCLKQRPLEVFLLAPCIQELELD